MGPLTKGKGGGAMHGCLCIRLCVSSLQQRGLGVGEACADTGACTYSWLQHVQGVMRQAWQSRICVCFVQ